MTRRQMGAHGEICKRVNEKIMMTVRPDPEVLSAEDCAMILGYKVLGATDSFYPHKDAVEAIAHYESKRGKLTQKKALSLLSDSYVLSNYTNYTDMIERFDEDDWNHRAIRAWVFRVFPKLRGGE